MPHTHAVIRPANHAQRNCRIAAAADRKRAAASRAAPPDSEARAGTPPHRQSLIPRTLSALIACLAACGEPASAQYNPAPGLRSAPAGSVGATVPSLSALSGPTAPPNPTAQSNPTAPANSAAAGRAAPNDAAAVPPAQYGLSAAAAQTPNVPYATAPRRRGAHPAVVRVVAPGRDSISYGSGSLVAVNDRHGLVITNWHVINEATGQITVEFPDGFESAATIQKADRDWDLAALAIWRPEVVPIRVARQAPRQGDLLTIAGYGSGRYRAASGVCTQYVAPGLQFPYEMVELAAAARQGDSGGPILNSQGELAGVLFGEGQGRTAGSYCGRVQWFLDSLLRDQRGGVDTQLAQVATPGATQAAATAAPAAGSAWPPRTVQIDAPQPVRSEAFPLAETSAPHTWRRADDLGSLSSESLSAASGGAPGERPLEVASLSKSAGQTAAAYAARPNSPQPSGSPGKVPEPNVSQSQNSAELSGDSLDERWQQIKAFFGVVATVGVFLLIVRSLQR